MLQLFKRNPQTAVRCHRKLERFGKIGPVVVERALDGGKLLLQPLPLIISDRNNIEARRATNQGHAHHAKMPFSNSSLSAVPSFAAIR